MIRFGVKAANIGAPNMVDEDTRFEGAEALPGNVIQYNFTMLTETSDAMDEDKSDEVKPLRDIGATFRYRYSNRYGGLIALISISSSECTGR